MVNYSSLKQLSELLNRSHIVWGVGGSCLLALNHLYENPNDVDLWVQPSDMPKLRNIFKECTELPNDLPIPKEYRYKIEYFDLVVDFIACFITKPNQYKFEYIIDPKNLKYVEINETKIPCTYLEDWYIIYRLLKKDDKADIIQQVFAAKEISIDDEAIRDAINNKQISIPHRIKADVYNLITAATQMTMFDGEAVALKDG